MTISVPFRVKINEFDNDNECKVRASYAGLPLTIRYFASLNPKSKGREEAWGCVSELPN